MKRSTRGYGWGIGCVAVAVVLVMLASSEAQAVWVASSPFGDITGTGVNGSVAGSASTSTTGFFDKAVTASAGGNPYSGEGTRPPWPAMYYQETWAQAKNVGTVELFNGDWYNRGSVGDIYVNTSAATPNWVNVGSYTSVPAQIQRININQNGIYGVKVNVTGPAPTPADQTHAMLCEVSVFSKAPGPNLALGANQISSPNPQNNTSVLDDNAGASGFTTYWRGGTNTGHTEGWVGFEFPGDAYKSVRALQIVNDFNGDSWTNFDVQIKQGGVWSASMFRAAVPGGTDLYWIDFGETLSIQGVRLYGSDVGLNNPYYNPNNSYGHEISEIAAFDLFVPEPASLSLLALGGLALLRRRRK